MAELQDILDQIAAEMATRADRGKVADYIPQLARIDPKQFGIAVALPDGSVLSAGDAWSRVAAAEDATGAARTGSPSERGGVVGWLLERAGRGE